MALLGMLSVYTSVGYIQDSRQLDARVANHAKFIDDNIVDNGAVLIIGHHAQTIMYLVDVRGWFRSRVTISELDFFIEEGVEQIFVLEPKNAADSVSVLEMHPSTQRQRRDTNDILWDVLQ